MANSARTFEYPRLGTYVERIGMSIRRPYRDSNIPFNVPLLVVGSRVHGLTVHLEDPDQQGYDIHVSDLRELGAFTNRPDLGEADRPTMRQAWDRRDIRLNGEPIRPVTKDMRLRRTDAVYSGYIPPGITVTVLDVVDGPMLGYTVVLQGDDDQEYRLDLRDAFTTKFFSVLQQ